MCWTVFFLPKRLSAMSCAAEGLIVNPAGTIEQRILNLDRAIGSQWLVSSGLAVGDRVVVEGMQKVRPGASVKVVSADGGANQATNPGKTVPAASK